MKFEYAAESLRDNFFKVSCPMEFNDPFECRGHYENFDVALRKYVHDNYERLKFEAIRMTGSRLPEQQDRFTERFLFDSYFDTASRVIDSSWLKAINDTVLMLCLVKERGLKPKSDVLFWSHYADSGKGIRIILDLEKRVKGGIYYMQDVDYLDEAPVFDCRKMKEWLKGPEFRDYIERLAHVKGRAWEYENEVRMIIPRSIPRQMMRGPFAYLLPREIDGARHYFVRIDYDVIRRVDFGPRVDEAQAAKLVADLQQREVAKHIAFWQAVLSPGAYTYTYKKVA